MPESPDNSSDCGDGKSPKAESAASDGFDLDCAIADLRERLNSGLPRIQVVQRFKADYQGKIPEHALTVLAEIVGLAIDLADCIARDVELQSWHLTLRTRHSNPRRPVY